MEKFESLRKNDKKIVLKGYHWSQDYLDKTPDDGVFFLSLNMTSQCNYRCPYCFIGHKNLVRSKDELSRERKFKILEQAKELGAHVIVMPGRGEPLADPDVYDVIDHAASLGLYVVIDTNIFFLDEEKIQRLKSSPVSLFAKVDSLQREAYEKSVGAKNVYDKLRKNLDLLVEHFHEPEQEEGRLISRLGINAVITKINADSLPELQQWCEERDIYFTCRSPVRIGEAHVNWDDFMGDEVLRLRTLGLNYAHKDFTSTTEGGHCGIYRFGITVENNGDIYVCPQSRIPLANLNTSTLQEAINIRNNRGLLNKEAGYCFAKDQYNEEGAFTRETRERQINFEHEESQV